MAPLMQMPFFYAPHMTLVRLYLRQNRPDSLAAAAALLEQLEQFLAATHNVRFLMETLALKALYWQAVGDMQAARKALARAIDLGEPGGYVRVFADLGQALDGLLADLQQAGAAPLLVAAIRAAIAPETPAATPPAPAANDDLAVLLTFREQEVLRLLGKHLTDQEIAAALYISTETVKRHSNSIFRKLHVKNRRAAALYARRLLPA